MEDNYKIVTYELYCKNCEHKDLDEDKDPCHDCLNNPVNVDSHRPMYFKKR